VEIMDLLCEVNVRGTTVVVATHDASLIERYDKRTIRLERGMIVGEQHGEKAARRMAISE
jgi:cell division transport system ATP-binding protein